MPKKDIAGQRFGRLVAVRDTGLRKRKKSVWECRCDCGRSACVRIDSLTTGNTLSCGCFAREKSKESALALSRKQGGKQHPRFIDMTNETYGRLTVLQYAPREKKWLCQCSCGRKHLVGREYLTSGRSRSCGCLDAERMLGENNHNWNPDLTDEDREDKRITTEYRGFVRSIFVRDSFACCICGSNSPIHAHHLNSYAEHPDQRLDKNNAVTLCQDHHREFHSWMGGTGVPCTKRDFYNWANLVQRGYCPAP